MADKAAALYQEMPAALPFGSAISNQQQYFVRKIEHIYPRISYPHHKMLTANLKGPNLSVIHPKVFRAYGRN